MSLVLFCAQVLMWNGEALTRYPQLPHGKFPQCRGGMFVAATTPRMSRNQTRSDIHKNSSDSSVILCLRQYRSPHSFSILLPVSHPIQ